MGKLQASGRAVSRCCFWLRSACFAGCVERRYTIRSDPPGATVIVNGEEIGPTPASKSFVYYGDGEITLMLDGYETKTVIQPIKAPGGTIYFTEFFTENLVPVTFARRARIQVSTHARAVAPARRSCAIAPRACAARPGRCPSRVAGEFWDGSAFERNLTHVNLIPQIEPILRKK